MNNREMDINDILSNRKLKESLEMYKSLENDFQKIAEKDNLIQKKETIIEKLKSELQDYKNEVEVYSSQMIQTSKKGYKMYRLDPFYKEIFKRKLEKFAVRWIAKVVKL